MGTHSGQPFKGIKGFFLFIIFRFVNNLGFLGDIGHSLLGKGGSDDIPGQVFSLRRSLYEPEAIASSSPD